MLLVIIFLALATGFLAYSNGANDNFKGVASLSVKDVRPRPEEARPGRGAAGERRFNRGVPQERLMVFRGRRPPLSGA